MAVMPKAALEASGRLTGELSSTVGLALLRSRLPISCGWCTQSISSIGELSPGAMSMSALPGEHPRVCKGGFGLCVSDVRGGEVGSYVATTASEPLSRKALKIARLAPSSRGQSWTAMSPSPLVFWTSSGAIQSRASWWDIDVGEDAGSVGVEMLWDPGGGGWGGGRADEIPGTIRAHLLCEISIHELNGRAEMPYGCRRVDIESLVRLLLEVFSRPSEEDDVVELGARL